MSRVEENKAAINKVTSSIESIGGKGIGSLMLQDSGLMSNIIDMAALDILVDISKSLAVLADKL